MSSRKQFYEQQLDEKRKDLARVQRDLAGDNTQEEERRLNNRAEQLLEDIEELEGKLDSVHQDKQTVNQKNSHWEQHLYKIDYKEAGNLIDSTLNLIEQKFRAVLFVLEKSTEYSGKYCIQHLRDRLEKQGVVDYPYHVDFLPGTTLTPEIFLRNLVEKLQIKLDRSVTIACEKALDGICQSAKGRSILFLHINLELSDFDEDFLEWAIHDFWCGLVDRLPQLSKHNRYIKLVGVISIDETLQKTQTEKLCCTESELHPTKLLRLPLEKWAEPEIHRWLCSFSRLELEDETLADIAKQIFKRSNKGIPDSAERRLLESLEKLAS
ncbi:MAG: hypothetical protein VKJ24_15235 [Synechococcales bacterium]|nr:hypothetical protein [Synechococcales bacterium]